ncbi:MAG: hypothetical protein HY042_12740 [Spirochaetia bacterium]|nr:hypothetical protein [Spirochaetia bacterium]
MGQEQKPVRSAFQYPDRLEAVSPVKETQERALLLWRVIMRQPEAQNGLVRVFREPFLRAYARLQGELTSRNSQLDGKGILSLLNLCGRHGIHEAEMFCNRVAIAFQREITTRSCRRDQFSIDILFHTIELLSMNKSQAEAEATIRSMKGQDPGTFTVVDKESLVSHLRAYNVLNSKINSIQNLKTAIDRRDALIQEVAVSQTSVTLFSLDAMFRNIIAQNLLAKKYRCDTLIVEWIREYGFEADQMVRIARYIPYDSEFSQFRTLYVRAIQSLRTTSEEISDIFGSDLFLLRSLANFYTSWVMKVSEQLSAA